MKDPFHNFLLGVLLEHKSLKIPSEQDHFSNQNDSTSLKIFPQTEGSLIESQQLIIPKENKNSSLSPMTFPQQKIESSPINSNHEVLDLIQ